jgi:hypothetical protein
VRHRRRRGLLPVEPVDRRALQHRSATEPSSTIGAAGRRTATTPPRSTRSTRTSIASRGRRRAGSASPSATTSRRRSTQLRQLRLPHRRLHRHRGQGREPAPQRRAPRRRHDLTAAGLASARPRSLDEDQPGGGPRIAPLEAGARRRPGSRSRPGASGPDQSALAPGTVWSPSPTTSRPARGSPSSPERSTCCAWAGPARSCGSRRRSRPQGRPPDAARQRPQAPRLAPRRRRARREMPSDGRARARGGRSTRSRSRPRTGGGSSPAAAS